jgi:hypothetical protein
VEDVLLYVDDGRKREKKLLINQIKEFLWKDLYGTR